MDDFFPGFAEDLVRLQWSVENYENNVSTTEDCKFFPCAIYKLAHFFINIAIHQLFLEDSFLSL